MSSPVSTVAPYFTTVDAPSPQDQTITVRFGVRHETFQQYSKHGLKTFIGQFYDIVQNGLIVAEHAFRGLNRPMMRGEDTHADQSFIVYSWKPVYNSEWIGDHIFGKIERLPPPEGQVFVVIVRELVPPDGSGIAGEIERWNWVLEDFNRPQAPVGCSERYEDHLWSRIK